MSVSASRSSEFGALLRRVRLEEGLSQRELGKRLGLSSVSVSNAEAGADLRHDTLRKYQRALPGLTPAELLPGGRDGGMDLSEPSAIWTYYRDVVGHECLETTVRHVIRADGRRSRTIKHRGLRSIRDEPSSLNFLLSLTPSVYSAVPEMRGLRATSRRDPQGNEVRIRVDRSGKRVRHALSIPADVVKEGLSLETTLDLPPSASSRAQHFEARGRPDHGVPVQAGSGHSCIWPTRNLALKVTFPTGFFPEEAAAHAWPKGMVADPEMINTLSTLHPGVKLRRSAARSELSLKVPWPLMGFSYSIGWVLQ